MKELLWVLFRCISLIVSSICALGIIIVSVDTYLKEGDSANLIGFGIVLCVPIWVMHMSLNNR